MSNIIDSIQVSGVTYTIQGSGGGGIPESTFTAYTAATDSRIAIDEEVTAAALNELNEAISGVSGNNVVELTQAEYDALVTGGTVDPTAFYIITDATAGDLTQYWTSAQTQSAITSAISTKQDTLVSGTNIKTINNESILGSGNIDIQGGSSYTAGDGIDITNNVISVTGKVDTSTYNTYTAATDTALASKQTTLTAGTGISIIDNVISATGGGGGGKAVSGGTNISITTGETADTINCTLPISADTGGIYTTSSYPFTSTAPRSYNAVFGNNNVIDVFGSGRRSDFNALFGDNNSVKPVGGSSSSHFIAGSYNRVKGTGNFRNALFGYYNTSQNNSEFGCGQYNVSSSASTTFGNSGNTLFSVGNGTADNARHNAFEIRQNGDIYLTKDGQDVKLQDQLGGGEVSSAITSGDTNAVAGGALFDELRLPTEGESGLTLEWYNYDGGETTNYPSGSGCSKITFEVVASGETEGDEWYQDEGWFSVNDVEGNIHIAISDDIVTASAENGFLGTCSVNGNIVTVEYPTIADDVTIWYSSYDNHWTTTAYINSTVYTPLINQVSANTATLASLEENVNEIEEVAAAGLNALNSALGGLKLQQITQSAYDALTTKDPSTLYIIVN